MALESVAVVYFVVALGSVAVVYFVVGSGSVAVVYSVVALGSVAAVYCRRFRERSCRLLHFSRGRNFHCVYRAIV